MDEARTVVSGDKVHRPLMDDHVTHEDWEKAREELNETPEIRAFMLRRFREKIADDKADFIRRTDDNYFTRFLRTRKFDLERAYKLMLGHYRFRAKHPDLFPSGASLEKALRANIFNYLPHRDHHGRAIFLVKIGNWNPDEITYREYLATGYIVSEYMLENPVSQINGFTSIYDFKGFGWKQFSYLCVPKNIKLLISLLQDQFPGRLKIVYCVNCHPMVDILWNLSKPFFAEKLRKRIKILGPDVKALHPFVDPSILPVEYEGQMPPENCEDIVNLVLSRKQQFSFKG